MEMNCCVCEYKQLEIVFKTQKENETPLDQSVYEFMEQQGFCCVGGAVSLFNSKEPMSLEQAEQTARALLQQFPSLAPRIQEYNILEISKPQSLLHLFQK